MPCDAMRGKGVAARRGLTGSEPETLLIPLGCQGSLCAVVGGGGACSRNGFPFLRLPAAFTVFLSINGVSLSFAF